MTISHCQWILVSQPPDRADPESELPVFCSTQPNIWDAKHLMTAEPEHMPSSPTSLLEIKALKELTQVKTGLMP
jgi:hypothetical protein